ncbi:MULTISPECIES: cell division protein FtsQ/DivIB [Caproicibacterium]|uniref:FtsQ-type POTRA domain-containing protein n=1 Tax=Caproicibacterium argilliputei TaxID=3030016 RepID=A0AA97D6J2_9FIRM|nr:FtsQ-type POTRA domain-containing protein [Caproicibacterium argilliputei]WOC31505.1 FtsQ-type POTRA domain-containing protein [Caproicibacterium argilliputei]
MRRNEEKQGRQAPRRTSAGQRQRAYTRQRRRKRMQLLFYAAVFLVVVATAVVLCLTVLFKIQAVEVEGKSRYPQEQITAACGISTGENLFLADVGDAADKVKQACPYLGKVTVSRRLPAKIVIQVQESAVAGAAVWNGKYVYLDASGKVLEITAAAPADSPIVKGLDIQNAAVGHSVTYKNKQKSSLFGQIAQAVQDTGFTGVRGIDVSSEYQLRVTCKTKAGKTLTIVLGNATYLEKKFRFAKATIEQHLSDEQGTFDVSTVSKEKSITWFTPASSAASAAASSTASSKQSEGSSSISQAENQTEDTAEEDTGEDTDQGGQTEDGGE